MNEKESCCTCGSGCCQTEPNKELTIDFLYLDLSVCERCQGTENSLDQAIHEVSGVLESAGYDISVKKVNIVSEEMAIELKFVSSPTIRINGRDIDLIGKESLCEECGDLCGDQVECRVWVYNGREYNEPPKEMIVNAILREIYGNGMAVKEPETAGQEQAYRLPENLKRFFDGLKDNKGIE